VATLAGGGLGVVATLAGGGLTAVADGRTGSAPSDPPQPAADNTRRTPMIRYGRTARFLSTSAV
jgi:hypothetical protein